MILAIAGLRVPHEPRREYQTRGETTLLRLPRTRDAATAPHKGRASLVWCESVALAVDASPVAVPILLGVPSATIFVSGSSISFALSMCSR